MTMGKRISLSDLKSNRTELKTLYYDLDDKINELRKQKRKTAVKLNRNQHQIFSYYLEAMNKEWSKEHDGYLCKMHSGGYGCDNGYLEHHVLEDGEEKTYSYYFRLTNECTYKDIVEGNFKIEVEDPDSRWRRLLFVKLNVGETVLQEV